MPLKWDGIKELYILYVFMQSMNLYIVYICTVLYINFATVMEQRNEESTIACTPIKGISFSVVFFFNKKFMSIVPHLNTVPFVNYDIKYCFHIFDSKIGKKPHLFTFLRFS